MPLPSDHTSMWWTEGFPGTIKEAPWTRCISTGNYVFIMNTQTMKIPHLGSLPEGTTDIAKSSSLSPMDLGLKISVDGESYTCTSGGEHTRSGGPRLVESGTFFQRGDITNLSFTNAAGKKLNTIARFESAAWTDRLSLSLFAEPGHAPIPAGEKSFGKIGGGFGLDGSNHFEIPQEPALQTENTTIEFWVFVPTDFKKASKHSPWLLCKNSNETSDGNIGVLIANGQLQGRLNIGGGSKNSVKITPYSKSRLEIDGWNHLALNYDGKTFRMFLNGKLAGEETIGKPLTHGDKPIVFGKRADNNGDGFHFYGAIDQINIYDRALTEKELQTRYRNPTKSLPGQLREWTFNKNGRASDKLPREKWQDASMEITLENPGSKTSLVDKLAIPKAKDGEQQAPHQVAISFSPTTFQKTIETDPVTVTATELKTKTPREVIFDPILGWHRVDLNGVIPIPPTGSENPSNDAMERITLTVANPTDQARIARLMFAKAGGGFKQRIGSAITGVSAILRDSEGNPTGIPVQLSKNWHTRPDYNGVHTGTWLHAITQLRLPANSSFELELSIVYGHWGGVPAASHAQLSLIGWGNNQHWQESALGSWGESICYEPEQGQADCTITDVRPLMVAEKGTDKWKWTGNVGGGDFLRYFDKAGERISPSAMQTTYHSYGPCLTNVEFSGKIGEGIRHSQKVSLARTDDIVRGVYHLRMDVTEPMDFSRFVVFQVGADTYNFTREKKFALGNESGLHMEWDARWGGDTYRVGPFECTGKTPWISMHGVAKKPDNKTGPFAQRGIVIRSWNAKIGGKDASPWLAEHGVTRHRVDSSTMDIVLEPGITRLEPGDFIEATFDHLVIPENEEQYYGSNEPLRKALKENADSWKMVNREATRNDPEVTVIRGKLTRKLPRISFDMNSRITEFTLSQGLGFVPVTFTGLKSHDGYTFEMDGKEFDQSIHGNDFWQTTYDPTTSTWSRTYNLPARGGKEHTFRFYETAMLYD